MGLIGKSQQLFVATAIAIGRQMIFVTIRIKGEDTTYLLLAITVGCQETASEPSVGHLYLGTNHL